MAFYKKPKKNPICKKCKSPVEITAPANRVGNAHGEVWTCPIHGNLKEIIIF